MHVNGTQNCVLVRSYCSYDAHHVDGNMYREVGAALWSYHKRPRPLSNNTSTTHWWWSNAHLSPDETLSHHIRCWKRSGRDDTNWRTRIVTFPRQEWLQSRVGCLLWGCRWCDTFACTLSPQYPHRKKDVTVLYLGTLSARCLLHSPVGMDASGDCFQLLMWRDAVSQGLRRAPITFDH